MMVLYNGELLPADAVRLPLPNRGLFFNDGFFETMVWAGNTVRYLPYHLARMQRAAAALGLELPRNLATTDGLIATLRHLTDAQPLLPAQRLRLQLWRAGGGMYTPETSTTEWLATSQAFQPLETSVTSCNFAETARTRASPVSFCKGPNALTYVLAARERQQRGLEELLLLSEEGYVAEAVAAAVGWLHAGTIYVPAEAAGGVAGTRLAHLRAVAATLEIPWREGLYPPPTLLAAEAVFTANITGIRAIQNIAGVTFHSEAHPLLQQLRLAEQTAAQQPPNSTSNN